MFAFIAVAVVVVIFIYTATTILISKKLTPQKIMMLWYIFIISLAILAFVSQPTDSGPDINRYFEQIDAARKGHSVIAYRGLYVFGLALWLVAKTPYNQLLQVGAVLLFGYLVGRIVKDYIIRECDRYSTKAILIYFWAALGGVSASQLLSGIRTALVCAIWVYCYHFFYEKKKLKFYLFMFGALFLHTLTIGLISMTIVYSFLEKYFSRKKMVPTIILLLFILLLTRTKLLPTVLKMTGNSYLSMLAGMFETYVGYRYYFTEFIVQSLPLIFYVPCALFSYGEAKRERGLMSFTVLVLLAASGMFIFYNRLFYAIGLLSFSSLNDIALHNKHRSLYLFVAFISIGVQMLFGFHAMFSHFLFNGINFRNMLLSLL